MKSFKLLLCVAVLFCLAAQVYAQAGQSPASNTFSDPAINEMKQYLDSSKKSDLSEKGKPPVNSPLAKVGVGQVEPQNYFLKADLFMNGIAANNSYIIAVPEFINVSRANPGWTILDIRPGTEYSAGHIENAMNIPISDLVTLMNMIPAGNKIAVYGDSDSDAAFGVMALRVFGDRAAYILQGGLPAWQTAGMSVV